MNRKINILLASSKYMPEYAGSGLRAHNQYKRLTRKHSNINVNVICGSETEKTCLEYNYDGLDVTRIASNRNMGGVNGIAARFNILKSFLSEYRVTRKYLNKLSPAPDLVHVFGKNYVTASVIDHARGKGIPLIVELCNEMNTPFQFVPFPLKYFIPETFPANCLCVCISEHLKAMCRRNGIPENKIWCRPNPVDEKRFRPADKAEKITLRKKLTRFGAKDKLLSYIANFRPSKNHIFLIEVIKELPEEYKLFLGGPIVGSGPRLGKHRKLFEDISHKIKMEELEHRVQLVSGFVENVEDYYRMADVYPFPTLQEGLGTPMLESIACGVPVVANVIPGATDVWIKNGANGFLAELSPVAFATKIREAVAFPTKAMRSESAKILEITGTNVIDMGYYRLIEKLVTGTGASDESV
jgi:glycosyltransferase involved in cell wall biosynthesis